MKIQIKKKPFHTSSDMKLFKKSYILVLLTRRAERDVDLEHSLMTDAHKTKILKSKVFNERGSLEKFIIFINIF